MKKQLLLLGLLILSILDLQAIPFKDNVLFTSRLDGSKVVPSVVTNAKGLASLMLNRTRDTISINISLVDLSGAPVNVSLYTGAEGTNGSSLIDLTAFIEGNKVTGRITGTNASTNISQLFRENVYLLVTTAANPVGEIRGQIRLEADWQFVTDLTGMEAIPMVTSSAYGLGSFSLSLDKSKLTYKVMCNNLSGAITSAKLHFGSKGSIGSLATDISSSVVGNIITGSIIPTSPLLDSLFAGKIYLNITTSTNSSGELRSQLITYKGLTFEALATGAEMVPAITTSAEALGVFRLSPNLDTLYYDAVVEGATTPLDYLHLHVGYAGNTYGAVQVDFTSNISGYRARGFKTGSVVSAVTKTRLMISNLALIVHTAAHPTGELRGQVIRYAREGFTMNMSGSQVVPAVSSNAYGSGIVSIGRLEDDVHYMWMAGNLASTATNASFYKNKTGLNGSILYDMSSVMVTNGNNASANGYWKNTDAIPFTASNAIQLSKDSAYLEIDNASFPNGEIRGQVFVGHVSYVLKNERIRGYEKETIIDVSPNPVRNLVRIDVQNKSNTPSTISILNLNGQSVYQIVLEEKSTELHTQIDLSELSNGIYFVKVVDDKLSIVRKVVKV
jgi:CHRD domain/Secretion system C-terminal sorting domain